MTAVYSLPQITAALEGLDVAPAIEAGFVAYSRGEAMVPPVGELLFADPPGDAHIKYGYLRGDDVFVIKIATGFYDNPRKGLPGNSGVMLVFDARVGTLRGVLLDEGHLTNVRTAIAGAITAKWLSPKRVERIAVLGTGLQARMQVEEAAKVVDCRRVIVWGRRPEALDRYRSDMARKGFDVHVTTAVGEATLGAQLVITTTASETPILGVEHIGRGTHIVAMGSDTETKRELTPELVGAAEVYVVDSLSQCLTRGELHHAVAAETRRADSTVELGRVIAEPALGRRTDEQITIADLTGVAVQDIAIAKSVCAALTTPTAVRAG